MSPDDNLPISRPTPRFVPTLTEIVAPPAATAEAGSPPSGDSFYTPASSPSHQDASVMALLARLGPELDARISETIAQVLHEHMPILNARIRQAVTDVVRETVSAANLDAEPPKHGENP